MKTRIVVCVTALALCTLGTAWSDPGSGPREGKAGLFQKADTNGDGKVTLEELKALAPNMTAERFAHIDANGDGALTLEEVRAAGPRDRGGVPGAPGRRGIAERLRKADANGDDKVSLEELQAVAPKMTADNFKRLDRDGDGFITKSDIPPGGHRGRPPMREIAKKADTDGNRQITFEELSAAVPEITRERFNEMDRNGDGVLSPADNPNRRGPGQRPRAGRGGLREKLRQADTNADGQVTYEEARAAKPDLPKEVFDRLDRNGDGVVSKEDARGGGRL
ncbi:MAG: hypothetical protein GWP08_03525 [Nitrospiraceae bacterium]|nr:hypothetical protein [Nitrospiraceae bacterium]